MSLIPNKRIIPFTIYAVDFDNTLAFTTWPEIIGPNPPAVEFVRRIQLDPDKRWILWTCREGDRLLDAVEWCMDNGLFPDAVNDNLPEASAAFGGNSRKVYADHYIDDKADFSLIYGDPVS